MKTKLQAARRAKGITATWICRSTGIDPSRYSRLEHGLLKPTDDELQAIGFLLGCDAERLREPRITDDVFSGPRLVSIDGDRAYVSSANATTVLLLDRPDGGVDFRTYPELRKPYLEAMRLRKPKAANDVER